MKSGLPRTALFFISLLLGFTALPPQNIGQAFAAENPKRDTREKASSSASSVQYVPDSAARIDYREITILPAFERYGSKTRWRDVDAVPVIAAIQNFEGIKSSPALRTVWRDVLLSDFYGLNIENDVDQVQLITARLHTLNKLGFFDEAVRLYQAAIKNRPIPESLARAGIESMALAGSADSACLEVIMAADSFKAPEWQENAALCHAYFGSDTKAQSFYDAVAAESDSGFRTLYKMLNGSAAKAIQPAIPPLWRATLLAKGATVSRQALSQADAMTLASLSVNGSVPLGVRLSAGMRAANDGTVGIDRLRKLYEAAYPSASAITSTDTQAAIYSKARFTFEGNARATLIQQGISALKPRTQIKAHVYYWMIDKLTLQPERITWFAPTGYAVMAAIGYQQSADIYYETGNLKGSTLSLVHAFQHLKPWPPATAELWHKAMKRKFGAQSQPRIDKALALAYAVDSEKKMDLLPLSEKSAAQRQKNLSNDTARMMNDSLRQGGRGLSLLLALNRLAKEPVLSAAEPQILQPIFETLSSQGLFSERRKLALEIFLQVVL